MARHPNILLIVVDCARADKWLGPDRSVHTPNLDRLAAGGTAFNTAITEKSCTTPSFSTLLTGQYSPLHGVHLVWGYRLPQSVPMLTEPFKAAGYHTYAEVSGPLLPEMGLARGFDEYHYRAPCDHLHTAWGDQFLEKIRGGYKGPWLTMLHIWELHPHRYVDDHYNSDQYGRDEYERAISSLDVQLGRIFDAVDDNTIIAFTGDHGEKTHFEQYQPGTAVEYARELLGIDDATGMAPYAVAGWAGPSVLQEMYGKCTPLMRDVRLRDRKPPTKPSIWRRMRDRWNVLRLTPMVYFHDLLALGAPLKLTKMLERRGLLDPNRSKKKVEKMVDRIGTDELLDMHMRMWINSYRHNYDEGHMVHVYDFLVRVPFVLHGPGVPPGVLHERMVRQPDFMPTLMDLAGVPNDKAGQIAGRSFRPLLDGQPWEPRPAFVSVSGCPADLEIRGVRTETHKFTYGPENDQLPAELYDLRADPGERNNIIAGHPERAAELKALADSFVPADGAAAIDAMELSEGERSQVEKQLEELGYL